MAFFRYNEFFFRKHKLFFRVKRYIYASRSLEVRECCLVFMVFGSLTPVHQNRFFFNFFAESADFAPRNNCVLAYITYLSVIADLVVIMINAEVAHG